MRGDEGSIIPLGIGLISISICLSLFFAELIGVQFQTVQAKQLSDVLAIEVSSSLARDSVPPVIGLHYEQTVQELVSKVALLLRITPSSIAVFSSDGKTIEAMVCTQWKSVTGFTFNGFGSVCSSSKSRPISADV
jgi:hypothetical protein